MGKSGNPAIRAEQEKAPVYAPTPVDEDGVEDFDAFWESVDRKGLRARVRGEVVQLVPSLPLRFQLEAEQRKGSESMEDVQLLLTLLGFPADSMERWALDGMDLEQFQVLLAWAPQRIAGRNVSLAQVAAELEKITARQVGAADPS